jgi:hypothetical protein
MNSSFLPMVAVFWSINDPELLPVKVGEIVSLKQAFDNKWFIFIACQ